MLCNIFFGYPQTAFFARPQRPQIALSAFPPEDLHFLQTLAGGCTKCTDTKSITRHRRNGERVALCHYLARAAIEHMAHRRPWMKRKMPETLTRPGHSVTILSMKILAFAYTIAASMRMVASAVAVQVSTSID